jgi:hypothetical protein
MLPKKQTPVKRIARLELEAEKKKNRESNLPLKILLDRSLI